MKEQNHIMEKSKEEFDDIIGMPFFSVIIPLYNKEKYIKRTLDTVLNQTFTNYEIVIVDDGSEDNSCEIVKSISDPRIRLISQKNGGPSRARNCAIREARGQYIAFLDADDIWLPEKLEKQHELHSRHPELAWSCCAYEYIGGYTKQNTVFQSNVIEDTIDAMANGLSIWTGTVVIKKDIFQNGQLFFDESISRSEDWELWLKMACLYPKVGYINKILASYLVNIAGSLVNTEMEKMDFSFLSLRSRIDKELDSIDEVRRIKVINYIDRLTQDWIMGVWRKRKDFSDYTKHFQPFVSKRLLNILNYTNFLPITMKKMILKVKNIYDTAIS